MKGSSATTVARRLLSQSVASQSHGVKAGSGGRSSNSNITATVFGAYGFIGRYFINELGSCGSRVYIPYRGCELEVRHLRPMFDLGGIGLMPFDPRDEASIRDSIRNSDVVINMIGKHYETKHLVPTRRSNGHLSRINYDFDEVHVDIPSKLARISKEEGIKSFIHISSLSAQPDTLSKWSHSKFRGEASVRSEFPEAIIVRPAVTFGWEDRFLNFIAESNERLPFTPLVFNGESLVQPVYALDIGKALFELTNNWRSFEGQTFQFAGPAEYSYKEINEFVMDVTGVRKPMINFSEVTANFMGSLFNETMTPIITADQIAQMKEDNVASTDKNLKSLSDLGIEPSSMDKYAFDFLHRFRPGGHFTLTQGYH
jgi:NADH dehydrogenase (ubiquinone) 1 alpha subcomplex subunit 9